MGASWTMSRMNCRVLRSGDWKAEWAVSISRRVYGGHFGGAVEGVLVRAAVGELGGWVSVLVS